MKVSIIMPTYQRPHTIRRAVDTVTAQTYADWELIIIDNEGVNSCVYTSVDPRISVYVENKRISSAYARNQGRLRATGDLICNFDDDDEAFPNYLARFVETFQAYPQAKMVRCGITLANGVDYFGYSTPTCCLRWQYAAPRWKGGTNGTDQRYYASIIKRHRWTEAAGDIVAIPEILCRANTDPVGGLRSGKF